MVPRNMLLIAKLGALTLLLLGTFALGYTVRQPDLTHWLTRPGTTATEPPDAAAETEPVAAPAPPALAAAAPTPAVSIAPTQTERDAAAQRAKFLTTRYSVPDKEVQSLTSMTYDLGAALGLDADERTSLDQSVLNFAEYGGAALRPFGIEGDPESIANQLRLKSSNALIALTRSQIVEAQTLIATKGLAEYMLHGQQKISH